jgi:hypothetical protein
MRYRHRVPRPPLDSFMESIWVYQTRPHALERIQPTGAAQLIVNLKEDQTRLYDPEVPHRFVATSGSVLSGVQSRFQVKEYVAGVAFKPAVRRANTGRIPRAGPITGHSVDHRPVYRDYRHQLYHRHALTP